MLTGTMKSELVDNARIWTLTVPVQPRPGQLIEWSEPSCGSVPARSGIRGWISSEESTRPGTVIVTVATEGTRWVVISLEGDTTMATKTAPKTMAHVAGDNGTWIERPDLTQCSYKTDKGRRCKLAQGHVDADGKATEHRMVLRSEISAPKTFAELRQTDAKFKGFKLVVESVPTTEDVSRDYQRDAEPRDDDQKRVDADTKKNYDAWTRKGSPDKSFEELGKMGLLSRYIVPPAGFDTVIAMLRRATQKGGPVAGKRLSYRRKAHQSGNAMIYFVIRDPKPGESE